MQVGCGSPDVLKLRETERPVVDGDRVLVRDPRGFGTLPTESRPPAQVLSPVQRFRTRLRLD